MDTVRVHLGERSYDVVVTRDPAGLGRFARDRAAGERAFLVSDEHLVPHLPPLTDSLERAGFLTVVAVLTPGEAQSSLSSAVALIYRRADMMTVRTMMMQPHERGF